MRATLAFNRLIELYNEIPILNFTIPFLLYKVEIELVKVTTSALEMRSFKT